MAKRMAVKTKLKKQHDTHAINFALSSSAKKVLLWATLSLLLLSAIFLLSKSSMLSEPVWPIQKVSFVGEINRVNKSQLIEELGLAENQGLLSIDLQSVRDNVLKNPWIESVEVRKQWPDTLVFAVIEKQPVAILNGRYLLANGMAVNGELKVEDIDGLLKIEISQSEQLEKESLVNMIQVLKSIHERLVTNHFSVESMLIDETNSWSIITSNQLLIKVGRKNQLQRLERFLQVYVAIENKSQLKSIDLRYRNGLAVELKSTSNTTSKES